MAQRSAYLYPPLPHPHTHTYTYTTVSSLSYYIQVILALLAGLGKHIDKSSNLATVQVFLYPSPRAPALILAPILIRIPTYHIV